MVDFSSFFTKSATKTSTKGVKKTTKQYKKALTPKRTVDAKEKKLRDETAQVWKFLLKQTNEGKKTKKNETNSEEDDSPEEEQIIYEPNKVVVNLKGTHSKVEVRQKMESLCGGKVRNVLVVRKNLSEKESSSEVKTTAFVEFENQKACQKV
jgi:hypothetical protein